MADTTIPISDATLARLRELARWAGTSIDEALDRAIKDQYDRQFWPATNAAYAALRADSAAWAEIESERRSMDGTLMDGLDPTERWTDEEHNISPVAQEHTP
jgi:hypothetical protein